MLIICFLYYLFLQNNIKGYEGYEGHEGCSASEKLTNENNIQINKNTAQISILQKLYNDLDLEKIKLSIKQFGAQVDANKTKILDNTTTIAKMSQKVNNFGHGLVGSPVAIKKLAQNSK